MEHETDTRAILLKRIRDKRDSINKYARDLEPRGTRLTNISIICGGLATLLTAGPAAGGPTFTKALTQLLGTSPDSAPSWRILCAAATALSFAATTAVTMYKSHDLSGHLAKAQGAGAKLEGLETSLELGGLDVSEAAQQYAQHIADIHFIPDR